jgi:flavin-dependent dehydrogenase
MRNTYDVIVVGARCAGSPTAMLLARRGYRVLVVDKASFPSDTMSTHFIHAPGVAALKRWGLLERLAATGCPPVRTYAFDFGPFVLGGSPRTADGIATAYGPRRTVLDKLLVDAAAEAGAELRESFSVDEIVFEEGRVAGIRGRGSNGSSIVERAGVVVGADGRHSAVAEAVAADRYVDRPTYAATYYTYWSGIPVEGFSATIRPRRSWGAFPTHDGLTLVVMSWPRAEFKANRDDVEGTYLRTLELVPEFAERIRAGRREERFVGTGDAPNFYRQPFGPGWALVGDAGYHKDPCTAQGISDAFRDAELLTDALDASFSGRRSFAEAMGAYQRARDEATRPMFELTCQFASLEQPPPPEMLHLLAAASQSREAMDGFVSMFAGTLSPTEFLSPENAGRIMAAAGAPTVL